MSKFMVLKTPTSSSSKTEPKPSVESKEVKERSPALVDEDVQVKILPKGRLVRGRGGGVPRGASLPPMRTLTPTYNVIHRFTTTSTANEAISITEMLGALGGIATSATTVQPWTSSFKINSITIWLPQLSSANNATIWWTFLADGLYPDKVFDSSIPDGITSSSALVFRPPKKSSAGFWVNSILPSSTALFTIGVTVGCIIDVNVDATLGVANDTTSSIPPISVTTATLGNIYYLALDGPSNNKIRPVSAYPTTS